MILANALYVIAVAAAAAVVFTSNPKRAIFTFSAYGASLTVLFLVLAAPDVALSEAAVGTAAVPLVALVALARMRGK